MYICTGKPCVPFTSLPSGNILNNYCSIAKPRNWHWYSVHRAWILPYSMHSCVCMYNSMQFDHIECVNVTRIHIQNCFITTRGPLSIPFSNTHHPLATTNLFSTSIILSSQECYLVESYSMQSFEIRSFFFFLAQFLQGPSKFLRVSIVRSFSLLSSMLWCVWATVCLNIYLLRDIWVISKFLLFRMKLLWLFPCRFLCERNISFLHPSF